MNNNEIFKDSFFKSSYIADELNEKGEQKYSDLTVAVQVIFDQHLQVDLELSSGILHKDKFIAPSRSGFIWMAEEKISLDTPLAGSVLVATASIVAIHFPKERDYLMIQQR